MEDEFVFVPNSLVNEFPHPIPRILTKHKIDNSYDLAMQQLSELKPPRHSKTNKLTLTKMRGLAMCQMQSMDIVLR